MKDSVHVFIYLTGPGWNILTKHGFLAKDCRHQFSVKSQLGCSRAVLSTTLTGAEPHEHGHFSSYYLKKSDTALETAQRFYGKLKSKHSGYFGKYSVPIRNLSHFLQASYNGEDLTPGCFSPLVSIIDLVDEKKLAYSIVNTATNSPIPAFKDLDVQLKDKSIDFAFIKVDELDSLLHNYPHDFQKIDTQLKSYEQHIQKIISTGNAASKNFNLTVLSGHGMAPAPRKINIKKKIDSLGMSYGHDYHAVYDPTIVSFWFKNSSAKAIIIDKLKQIRHCRVLGEQDKKDFGIYFPDNRFGETIALLDSGYQISPNDVLSSPLPAMHGYEPSHPDSLGACLSTQAIKPSPQHVKDFFNIMANFVETHA